MPDKDDPVVIKKYANRRLYHTGTSCYITLEDLAQMVRDDEDFVVQDAKTSEDITHSVLTQIIFELENNKSSQNLLPIPFLRQMIAFYGDQMEAVVPSYLEQSMKLFVGEQERVREKLRQSYDAPGVDFGFPMKFIEEQTRRNLRLFQDAMQIFATPQPAPHSAPNSVPPEMAPAENVPPAQPVDETKEKASETTVSSTDLQELRDQLAAMQKKIDRLS